LINFQFFFTETSYKPRWFFFIHDLVSTVMAATLKIKMADIFGGFLTIIAFIYLMNYVYKSIYNYMMFYLMFKLCFNNIYMFKFTVKIKFIKTSWYVWFVINYTNLPYFSKYGKGGHIENHGKWLWSECFPNICM
jgi:hypothetical protein